MRIICCDDDAETGKQIEYYLREYFEKYHLVQPEYEYFSSGEELLGDGKDADIVFLDVEMPEIDGISVGTELKQRKPDTIIFIVTSYPDYLDDAMRFQVFRYLSKPIDKERLFRNLRDALVLYNTSSEKIAIETKTGVDVIRMADVVCIEAKDRKVLVHTEGKICESVQTMQFWVDNLTKGCFFQTHRSYIVNMEYVSRFDKNMVYLCGEKYRAYLTRRKYKSFKDAYLLYLASMR